MVFHLNGQLVLPDQARISPLDRGFVFGDGIYEGLRAIHVEDGNAPHPARIIGWKQHVERMNNGLRELAIDFDAASLEQATHDLLSSNGMTNAFVYWQVTSGTPRLEKDPPRSRLAPAGLKPTVFGYCTPQPSLDELTAPPVKKVITCRDIRWEMGQIKAISLCGNVWATRQAARAGAEEVIFTRNGLVTEGLATNLVFAFTRDGRTEIATPALDSAPMLAGITRSILVELLPELAQRPIREQEIEQASEVMLIGTTTMVTTIGSINGRAVGDGRPGPVARRLHDLLVGAIREGRDIE